MNAVGPRSTLTIAIAPAHVSESDLARDSVWVVLTDLPGRDSPANRPGSQAAFTVQNIEKGLPPAELAGLLTSAILEAGVNLDRAREVLNGPPVSPADAKVLRKLRAVIATAEKLSLDLQEIVRDQYGKSNH